MLYLTISKVLEVPSWRMCVMSLVLMFSSSLKGCQGAVIPGTILSTGDTETREFTCWKSRGKQGKVRWENF